MFQVGLNDQRRFGLSDKHVSRRRQTFRTAQPHRFTQQPGQAKDHFLQNTQVVKYGRKGRKEYDRRQHLEGKNKAEAIHVLHQATE